MTMTKIVMPQLGETVSEGTISRWLVKPGDRLTEFAPMLEVDTDKVNAEVPAPFSGVLTQILAQEGETVRVGAEIAVVEIVGEETTSAVKSATATDFELREDREPIEETEADGPLEARISPAAAKLAREHGVDVAKVRGTGLGGRV